MQGSARHYTSQQFLAGGTEGGGAGVLLTRALPECREEDRESCTPALISSGAVHLKVTAVFCYQALRDPQSKSRSFLSLRSKEGLEQAFAVGS